MVEEIKKAAKAVNITAIITNSDQRIETQLNSLTGHEDLPIMLVSWDLDTELSFDEHGFLNNPSTKIVLLLMTKAEDTSKEEAEIAAEKMGALYILFIQELYKDLIKVMRNQVTPITGAGYKLVPKHGAGKHSGILGRFTMLSTANVKCN